jgi:hypothetical protein
MLGDMDIKERIANIKKILPYCSHWSNEVMIVDEELGRFFSKFFTEDDRFETPEHDHTYVKIWEDYTGYGCDPQDYQEIRISYRYHYDRSDGEDWVSYHFEEPIKYKYDFLEPKVKIKFEEIPDRIWKIIQDQLYENAIENVNKELESAKKSFEYWQEKKNSFDKKLKLYEEVGENDE